jgi:4-hydroxy-tetrahydrodipicolinate synthase
MNQSKDRISSNDLKQRLSGGLIPATPVPFDSSGKLHVRAHDSYLRYMAEQAIAGVAVWAHTGRGLLLDQTTAQRVVQDWRNALPNKVLIAGVGARGSESGAAAATKATLRMAECAIQFGADALLLYAPTWLRHHPSRDKLIVEHHLRISQLGLPLILFYLYEAAGGVSYTPEVLDELLSLPNVVGIKVATLDSVMTYQDLAQQLQTKHPDKLLITGEDRFLGYSLRRGAQTALIGMAAVCCELQSEMITAHFDGNAGRFLALSDSVDQLAEGLFVNPMEGYVQRILYALAHLGVIPTDGAHDPWAPNLSSDEFARIGRLLNSLMACTS